MFADCPMCDQPIEVDHVHNGIGMTWHAVHCGWGHEFTSKDVYEAYSAADLAEARTRRGGTDMNLTSLGAVGDPQC